MVPRALALLSDFDFSEGMVWRLAPPPKAFSLDESRYVLGADLPDAEPPILSEHLTRSSSSSSASRKLDKNILSVRMSEIAVMRGLSKGSRRAILTSASSPKVGVAGLSLVALVNMTGCLRSS